MKMLTAAKKSTRGKLSKSFDLFLNLLFYFLICFLVKSHCPVTTAENTEADNLIAVLDDSNLTNNAHTICQAISMVDWRLEGNAEDIWLLMADWLALEDHRVDLQVLLNTADEDSEDNTHNYIRTGSPVPFEPCSCKHERSHSVSMTSSKPSVSHSRHFAPLLNSWQSSQQLSSHQEPIPSYNLHQLNTVDMPKGHSCDHKWWVNEGWIRAEALLRLWGCDNGVSNNSLLAWQWGVSEEGSKGVEQYANYSNYGSLINDRNDRYKGGGARILLSQRGDEKVLGELGCTKWSARRGKRSTKREVSGSERTKLIKVFRKVFKTWSQEGKLLLAFCMVSTVIKQNTMSRMGNAAIPPWTALHGHL